MKCEECLPLIEEYVDGELNEPEVARLESHLTACAACAQELEFLGREQEIYGRYQRDLEVTPTHWNIVRARIEQEKDAQGVAPQQEEEEEEKRRKQWFGSVFAPLNSFRPAFIAALILIAVGVTAGIMYLSYRNQKTDVARFEKPKDIQTANPETKAPEAEKQNGSNKVASEIKEPDIPERGKIVPRKNRSRDFATNNTTLLAKGPRPIYRRRAPGLPIGAASVEEVAVRKNDPLTGDFEFDISRHAERAQMLLRSFRNMQTEGSNHASDVSYEKVQSRKLLYQNIALRRNAAGRRDEPARELLDTLEPILLDIANLPDKARAQDVRSIEQRMEKKEIVAALQVRRLLASN
jgi:hypothetical protein